MKKLTLILLTFLLIACGLAAPIAPTPTVPPTLPPPTATTTPTPRAVTFPTADGVTLNGILYGKSTVAVIFSNMGDKHPDSWAPMVQTIVDEDYMVLTYDFRYWVNNQIDNSLIKFVADDLSAAVTFVRGQGAQQVVLVGASMGGIANAKAAAKVNANAVVIIASPMDASGAGVVVQTAELQAITVPKLFITSERDRTVDPEALKQMYGLALNPKELYVYPNATAHGTDLFATEHGADLKQRLTQFIKNNAPLKVK